MSYKGNLPPGSHVEAELSLDESARGSALITIAFAAKDDTEGHDSGIAAPGGFTNCEVETSKALGRLRIYVDLNSEADQARLVVRIDGAVREDEIIQGDTSWAYSLS